MEVLVRDINILKEKDILRISNFSNFSNFLQSLLNSIFDTILNFVNNVFDFNNIFYILEM